VNKVEYIMLSGNAGGQNLISPLVV